MMTFLNRILKDFSFSPNGYGFLANFGVGISGFKERLGAMPHIEGTCSLIISNECGSTVFGFDTFLHTVDVSFDPIHLISCLL